MMGRVPPAATISSASSSSRAPRRATTATRQPSAAKTFAMPRPIPRLAPVTRQVLSCSLRSMVPRRARLRIERHTLAAASFIFSPPRRPRGHSRGSQIRAATPVAGALQGLDDRDSTSRCAAGQGPPGQSRSPFLRHVRRDRRGPGGRALVFPRRRRRRHDREEHLGVRHAGQRRDLRQLRALRVPRAPRSDARLRAAAQSRAARRSGAATRRRSSRSPTRCRRAASAATTSATAGWASSSRRGPAAPSQQIVIHVRMLDLENARAARGARHRRRELGLRRVLPARRAGAACSSRCSTA